MMHPELYIAATLHYIKTFIPALTFPLEIFKSTMKADHI